jgi:hypothetical protein
MSRFERWGLCGHSLWLYLTVVLLRHGVTRWVGLVWWWESLSAYLSFLPNRIRPSSNPMPRGMRWVGPVERTYPCSFYFSLPKTPIFKSFTICHALNDGGNAVGWSSGESAYYFFLPNRWRLCSNPLPIVPHSLFTIYIWFCWPIPFYNRIFNLNLNLNCFQICRYSSNLINICSILFF